MTKPFAEATEAFRDGPAELRPVIYPGINKKTGKKLGKQCLESGWQLPNHMLPKGTQERWLRECGHWNVGLNMGTVLSDGTRLGGIDIDHDDHVNLGKVLLRNPPSGRFGSKGALFFVRYLPTVGKTQRLSVKNQPEDGYGQVLELLFDGTLCVIPPSIHPDTGQPYRWIGTPLYEIDLLTLPLIGE